MLLETKLQEEEMSWIFLFIVGKQISNNKPCGFILFYFFLPILCKYIPPPLAQSRSPFPTSKGISKARFRPS